MPTMPTTIGGDLFNDVLETLDRHGEHGLSLKLRTIRQFETDRLMREMESAYLAHKIRRRERSDAVWRVIERLGEAIRSDVTGGRSESKIVAY